MLQYAWESMWCKDMISSCFLYRTDLLLNQIDLLNWVAFFVCLSVFKVQYVVVTNTQVLVDVNCFGCAVNKINKSHWLKVCFVVLITFPFASEHLLSHDLSYRNIKKTKINLNKSIIDCHWPLPWQLLFGPFTHFSSGRGWTITQFTVPSLHLVTRLNA